MKTDLIKGILAWTISCILILVMGLMFSCTSETALNKQLSFKIGDKYAEGTIFYVLLPGDTSYDPDIQHGFIVSDDLTTSKWGCVERITDLGGVFKR